MKRFTILLLLFLCQGFLLGQTNVSGIISSNTTWTLAGSPYIVVGDVQVPAGVTLTVEPGVVVKYSGAFQIFVKGAIIANGTANQNITFTSSVANQSSGATQIRFSNADLSLSHFDYVVMEWASRAVFTDVGNTDTLKISNLKLLHNSIDQGTNSYSNPRGSGSITLTNLTVSNSTINVNNSTLKVIGASITDGTINLNYAASGANIEISQTNFLRATFYSNRDCWSQNIIIEDSYFKDCNIRWGSGQMFEISRTFLINTIFEGYTNANIIIKNSIISSSENNILNFNTSDYAAKCTIQNSSIIGNGNNTGINTTNGSISNTTIQNTNVAIKIGLNQYVSFSGDSARNSNLINSTLYAIENKTSKNIPASQNYWGTTNSAEIAAKIYDGNDDINYGVVNTNPILNEPDTSAPISLPQGVNKIPAAGGLKIIWNSNPESDRKGYKVYYGNFTGYTFSNIVNVGTDTSITLPGLTINDTVAVTGYDTQADGINDQIEGHESWYSFSILAPPSTTVGLIVPQTGVKNQPVTINFKWHTEPYAEKYQLQIATDTSFSVLVFNDSTLTDTVKQLTLSGYNQTYYWRVRANNVGGNGPYSSVWNFTTTLANPVLTSPSNGAENISTSPTLQWNGVPGAALYHLQVSLDSAFTQKVFNDSLLNAASQKLGSLLRKTVYYWRVRAGNNDGYGGFSVISHFTTYDTSPETPTLLSPANGSTNQPTTITLSWNASARAATYQLQLATDSLFSSLIFNDSTLTSTSKQISSLNVSAIYYWRVRALNPGGISAYSSTWHFTTLVPAPSITTINAGNKKVTIYWTFSGAGNITKYRIYRGTSSGAEKLNDSVNVPATSYQDNGITNGQRYYYKVSAVNEYQAESPLSNEVNAVPFNIFPKAVSLNNIYDSNTGKNAYKTYTFSSAGSSDADGTIDSVFWYINGKLKSDSTVLTYQFGPGTNKIKLIVQDNDGAQDTSVATVTRVFFRSKLGGPIYSGVSLIGDDILYTVASGDAVYKLHLDGSVEYPLQVNGNVRSSSSIAYDSTVYIASSDRNLYAFSKYGTQLWPVLAMGAELSVTPTIDSISNRLYVGVTNRNFQAINRSNGTVAWSYFSDAPIQQSAVITSDRRLIFSTEKGTIYGFDLDNITTPVKPTWTLSIGDTITTSPAIDQNGNFYVGTSGGKIVKVIMNKIQTGTIVWQTFLGGKITSSPVIDANGILYIGSSNGKLYAVNTATGNIKWEFSTSAEIRSTASISNSGNIYFGNDDGELYVLDSLKNVVWYYQDSTAIAAPILTHNGIVYFGTTGGKIVGIYDADSIRSKNAVLAKSNSTTRNLIAIWGTFQGNNQRTGLQSISIATGIAEENGIIPKQYSLSQNYPNPFNPSTVIQYDLPKETFVTLKIYDVLGREVKTLVNEEKLAGSYKVNFDAAGLSSGIYLYRITAGKFIETKKLVLIR